MVVSEQRPTDDSVIFRSFWELVSTANAFKSRNQIGGWVSSSDLEFSKLALVPTLLAHADLPSPILGDILKPTSSTDPLEKCSTAIHLIHREKSKNWSAYLDRGPKAVDGFEPELSQFAGEDLLAFREHIDEVVCAALGATSLEEDEQSVLHDTVVLLSVDGSDGQCPKSVDVYLEYYYRTQYNSVEFFCNVCYRANTKMTLDLETNIPRGPLPSVAGSCGRSTRQKMACNRRKGMEFVDQLHALHASLYGMGSDGILEKISRLALVRLLLGSVGFVLDIAEHDGKEAEQIQVADLRWGY
ncbi:hypothetical protein DFS33DRAFT_1270532 [Desarmillaria ectypa]|nr:hypothetical protein DFS33DRAFT_1270532 [Desarmillaria ectypa]